ncbi:hypothetical protein IT570_13170 [Candidatus Sumerlaeota bacterium]|nr:hypothetical protein [Candidatus Sumerlaeota bacterium]
MMRLAILILMAVFSCACGGRKISAPNGQDRSQKPVVFWLDEAYQQGNAATLSQWMASARAVGATHVAFEARDASGTFIDPRQKSAALAAASAAGLRLAAVLPLFIAQPDAAPEALSQRAFWNGSAYELRAGAGTAPLRLSPAIVANRQREADAVRNLASDGKLDFIILSGCGFEDSLADLSPAARRAYESWAGISTLRWPLEVIGETPGFAPIGPMGRGHLWSNWMLWRATMLRDFLFSLHEAMSGSSAKLVVLVDAPYPAHQREGLNWAGAQSPAISDFPWLTSVYASSASGHLVDVVALGFWRTALSAEDAQRSGDAWWASVDGASAAARKYIPRQTKRWGAVLVDPNGEWRAAATRALQLNDGLILIGAKNLQTTAQSVPEEPR